MTAADLARILAQPGYSLADPSALLPSPSTLCRRPGVADASNVESCQNDGKAASSPSYGVWRSEWDFQSAVIAEAKLRAIAQPEYAMLVAIPNGQYRKGQRAEAGLTAGMPDLMLCVPRGGAGALFIELKCGSNKPSKAQLDMHSRLRRAGYRVVVVWDSVGEVMRVIEEYLAL